jgi:hypothetical protein
MNLSSFVKSIISKKSKGVVEATPAAAAQPIPQATSRPGRNRGPVPAQSAPVQPAVESKGKDVKVSFKGLKLPSVNLFKKFKLPSFRGDVKVNVTEVSRRAKSAVSKALVSDAKRTIESLYKDEKSFRGIMSLVTTEKSEDNLVAVKKELKAQNNLIERFPGKILNDKKLSARKAELESAVLVLESELQAKHSSRRVGSSLSSRISQAEAEAEVFRDITKIIK